MPSDTKFRRYPLYKETYLLRVKPYPKIREKLRQFMEHKRHNPDQSWGGSDKFFKPGAVFYNSIPGIRHAHLTHDLSVVYRVGKQNEIYLYGVFTHDDLGMGTPANIKRQQAISTKLANQVCV